MKKITVTLKSYTPITSEEGIIGHETTDLEKLKGMMLPVSSQMAQKDYGYKTTPAFQFYTKSKSANLLEGNLISYQEKDYHIVAVSDYGKVKEVLLASAVGKSTSRRVVQSFYY